MPAAPLGEIFVHKFTVFAQKRIGKDRECHHILLTHLADNIHESFLIFQDIIDIIDDKGAIRVFFAAEKRFKIVSIEYREICESGLIDAEVRLVQLIDDALKFLVSIILRTMDKIVAFAIFLPEIEGIDEKAGEATSARRSIACPTDKLADKICISGEVLRGLCVKTIDKIKPAPDKLFDIVSKTIRHLR